MEKFITYQHHGRIVWVRRLLKGIHRRYCLCYNCAYFHPGDENNCVIANAVHALNVLEDITTPVWECPKFREKINPALEGK